MSYLPLIGKYPTEYKYEIKTKHLNKSVNQELTFLSIHHKIHKLA